MRSEEFRAWLAGQGQVASSVSTRLSDAKRVEAHYGDLDRAFADDRLEGVLASLAYSGADRASGRPNPTPLVIEGDVYNSLASYRSAVSTYRRFLQESDGGAASQADRIRDFVVETAVEPARRRGERQVEVIAGEVHRAMQLDNAMPAVCSALDSRKFADRAGVRLVARQGPANSSTVRFTFALDGALDPAAMRRLRDLFLARFPDFRSFEEPGERFRREEDDYKRALIALAAAALAGGGGEEMLGGALLDVLTGQAGQPSNLLGWRTEGRVKSLRKEHPGVLEAAAGRLARATDLPEAIGRFVGETWEVLAADQASKPYSESRNLPTMLAALAHPARAYGINTEPVSRAAQMLLGEQVFSNAPMTADQYRRVVQLAELMRDQMRDVWGWRPRDLWDVQSFIWVTCQKAAEAEAAAAIGSPGQGPSMPTNLILYGPPGTGKTYATAEHALRLCGEDPPDDRTALMQRYGELVREERIAFVTFHQSYAYEDFVEGLRPVTGNGDEGEDEAGAASGGFRLRATPGVFRRIAQLADQARRRPTRGGSYQLGERQVFKMSLGRAGYEDHIYDAAIKGGYVVLGWGGEVDWSGPEFDGKGAWQAVYDRWRQVEPETTGYSGHVVQTWRFRSSMQVGDLVVVSQGNSRFRAVGEITGPYRFDPSGEPGFNHRRNVRWLLVLDEPLSVELIYDKNFTMQSCYLLSDAHLNRDALARLLPGDAPAAQTRPDQFVLIIDEINRANISKVLGELITLLEPDKRLGMPNELTVRLPYSGDRFGVPANLHIVGTMNTADRSIALIDKALRRRFTFREMMPDPDLPELAAAGEQVGVDLPRLLRTVNDRIEYLLDREHQIGHAWLLGCDDRAALDAAMRDRIIPLIAEYFFEDWGKVADVLGGREDNPFLERVTLTPPPGMAAEEPRFRWKLRPTFAEDAYDRACGG